MEQIVLESLLEEIIMTVAWELRLMHKLKVRKSNRNNNNNKKNVFLVYTFSTLNVFPYPKTN